jgi:UDP-glucose 4-epimerase
MTWLITGGCGYIGAHVVREFLRDGIAVAVLDNLSTGKREFIPAHVPFHHVDLNNKSEIEQVFAKYHVDGVVHLAGYKAAGESVSFPLHTYRENVVGMLNLLEVMTDFGVNKIVFSSSASVYGTPTVETVNEQTPTRPESPYGETKLIGEQLLRNLERNELRHTSLRYFNVIGSGNNSIYDTSAHNLLPLVFNALQSDTSPQIFGDTYPTPDGTCIRDYVHVSDVAKAHVSAAKLLEDVHRVHDVRLVYNLGSGAGTSVKEIITTIAEVTELPCTPIIMPPRQGDPPRIVADSTLAGKHLDWKMRYTLAETVQSAWIARTHNA